MISSISAQAKGIHNHSLYSGSKCAVEAFARCLAVDFREKITVNAIASVGIITDIYAEAARKYIPGSESWSDEKVKEVVSNFSPLRRVGIPTDVSRVVAYFASKDGGWMSGQIITIAGGAAM